MRVFKRAAVIPLFIKTWIMEDLIERIEPDSEELNIVHNIAGTWGSVKPHTDADPYPVWGLILHSDGHFVYQNGEQFLLEEGDVYCLDPKTLHGTIANDDSLLVFVVTSAKTYDEDPYDMGDMLLYEACYSMIEEKVLERQKDDMERQALRGIASI